MKQTIFLLILLFPLGVFGAEPLPESEPKAAAKPDDYLTKKRIEGFKREQELRLKREQELRQKPQETKEKQQ